MDLMKIGYFISSKRKELNLTQLQLAEKLGITDRAVSKWERGKSMPDASIMINLCQILGITVNDLLSGEVVKEEDSGISTDSILVEMVKQKDESFRKMRNSELAICILSGIFLICMLSIGIGTIFMNLPIWVFMIFWAIGLSQFVFAAIIAFRIEHIAGFFKCSKCGHRFVPENSLDSILDSGNNKTRYLECPKCKNKSWSKKIASSFLIVFLVVSLILSVGSASFSISYYYVSIPTTVYTPNSTAVDAYENIIDFSYDDIQALNLIGDAAVPSATRLDSATARYNCHSYAWYNQNTTSNNIWIDNPMPFVNDWSYEEISSPSVGSIILYLDGTTVVHSGIVISLLSGTSNGVCGDSNLVEVVSKWGYLGFYQHRGDECPYVSTYGGSATSVKYYRVHSHYYYDHFIQFNASKHKSYCACSEYVLRPHIFYVSIDSSQVVCAYCGYTTDLDNLLAILNDSDSSLTYITRNGSFILPDGTIVIYPDDIVDYLSGTLDFELAERVAS
ncbi:MAG: helix-turn-helix domain-containing protein [Clostridiales bacterium]|nr:helix-turn-helix domain-containing protein [Clostridiales bacterium]